MYPFLGPVGEKGGEFLLFSLVHLALSGGEQAAEAVVAQEPGNFGRRRAIDGLIENYKLQ